MISKKNPAWLEAHIELQNSMKKEIEVMREILANMHQEEYFLLSNDKISKDHVVEERSLLLKRFHDIRNIRLSVTETLEELSFPNSNAQNISLEECLRGEGEDSCETLFLRDQLVAIFNRMTMQNSRNQLLSKLGLHQQLSALQPVKKKIIIETMPRKELE